MFSLPDQWVWDFWLAEDGSTYHMYFLQAPKSLDDERLRHRNATIGHATSTDLRQWQYLGTVLRPEHPDEFDGTATWTGSVVCGPDGRWRMYYTGSRFSGPVRNVQTIALATSTDLHHWSREPGSSLGADGRWYERSGDSDWREEAWRDPWVFYEPAENRWHMLITARAKNGDVDDRGVIGHACSSDLRAWDVFPPLTEPASGYGHLEVPQVVDMDGRRVLVFSCDVLNLSLEKARADGRGGIYALPIHDLTGPFPVSSARLVTEAPLYSGRLVRGRSGEWFMLAFVHDDGTGTFPGVITDPMPVLMSNGRLSVDTSGAVNMGA